MRVTLNSISTKELVALDPTCNTITAKLKCTGIPKILIKIP